eukprot:scaffold5816_cov267-Pinguiococcus_pyrenoidosus.AAC.12
MKGHPLQKIKGLVSECGAECHAARVAAAGAFHVRRLRCVGPARVLRTTLGGFRNGGLDGVHESLLIIPRRRVLRRPLAHRSDHSLYVSLVRAFQRLVLGRPSVAGLLGDRRLAPQSLVPLRLDQQSVPQPGHHRLPEALAVDHPHRQAAVAALGMQDGRQRGEVVERKEEQATPLLGWGPKG